MFLLLKRLLFDESNEFWRRMKGRSHEYIVTKIYIECKFTTSRRQVVRVAVV